MAYVRKTANPPRPDFSWQNRAACRDYGLELFFAADGERQAAREIREAQAKKVCAGCPVLTECAEYSLSRKEHGIWAGMDEDERHTTRRRLARHRREAAA